MASYDKTGENFSKVETLEHSTITEFCNYRGSYIATVHEVIKHVLDKTHVKEPEHPCRWTIMHSDCVSYVYGSELQDKLFVCNICGEEINKSDMR